MRKGKSSSVDQGEGAKEGEEAAEGGEAAEEEGAADGEAEATAEATAEEANDKDAAEKTPPAEVSDTEAAKEPEKTPAEAPVTNGENGCTNGTVEENATHNHQEEEEKTTESSPVKKSKELGGVKEEANAKIINDTAVNSGELEQRRDSEEPPNICSSREGFADSRQPAAAPPNTNKHAGLALAVSGTEEEKRGEAESPLNGASLDGAGSNDWCEREEDEMRKRDLREAAVAIVQSVMSAATGQLEKELCVDNGVNGVCDADI